jgi:hypothetical protein
MSRRGPASLCRGLRIGWLALVLAGAGAAPLAAPAAAQGDTASPTASSPARPNMDLEARPGPRVMLCLYDADGHRLAGSEQCPDAARPNDAMMPEAHCFYDREGRLWRGLPRCPRVAPPFLMEEAARAE